MFPKYYVLEKLLEQHSKKISLEEYFIISVQHLMRSTGSLFEGIIQLGIEPAHIFLTGKIYSSNQRTIEKIEKLGINIKEPTIPNILGYYSDFLANDVSDLWIRLENALFPGAKIIILDDGGFALKSVPQGILEKYDVIGIEQTTSGIRLQDTFKKFPVIHLASSAAKTIVEPPIVSEAVQIQLGKQIRKLKPRRIGIIGFGHIGKAIAKEFCKNYDISVYDTSNETSDINGNKFKLSGTKEELYLESDVIIGATGMDISDLKWIKGSNEDKTLISVSSGDIEFNTIVRNSMSYLNKKFESPLQDLILETANGHQLKILRGGLVANFTGKPDSSPGPIIQMTRGLLMSSIIQVIEDFNVLQYQKGAVKLSPILQKEVISLWFYDQPQRRLDYSDEILEGFQDLEWIDEHN